MDDIDDDGPSGEQSPRSVDAAQVAEYACSLSDELSGLCLEAGLEELSQILALASAMAARRKIPAGAVD